MAVKIVLTDEHRRRIEEFRARHKTGVLTLVFTDMVGSTELKRLLGDAHGTALIEQQQSVVRETLKPFEEAEEISTAGDSFFVTFIRPSDAVRFALLVHAKLRKVSEQSPAPIQLRIGIHMGEVFIDTGGGAGGKTRDILGIQVDAASRVMLLAVGGQTLMTRSVFDNARAVLRGEDLESLGVLAWLNHGYFKAAGVEEPFEVCEVGEEKIAPLSPPPSKGKIQRFTVPELQPVIGWHPALELEVPTARGWVLREKIGEGGFGEVWRAQHKTLKEHRVFKFCFHADRARSLKREVALFRLAESREHPNIVRIHDCLLRRSSYYIVMEHIQATDLSAVQGERGRREHSARTASRS
jgi:class 3 adenylate cyclase